MSATSARLRICQPSTSYSPSSAHSAGDRVGVAGVDQRPIGGHQATDGELVLNPAQPLFQRRESLLRRHR